MAEGEIYPAFRDNYLGRAREVVAGEAFALAWRKLCIRRTLFSGDGLIARPMLGVAFESIENSRRAMDQLVFWSIALGAVAFVHDVSACALSSNRRCRDQRSNTLALSLRAAATRSMLSCSHWCTVLFMAHAYPVVLDWIDRLENIKSADGVWLSFLSFAHRYGFEYGAIADKPNSKWRNLENLLSMTWPEAWRVRYAAENYMRRDPSVRALGHTREPYTWAEGLDFDEYSKSERNIVFEARDFGLHFGLIVPITGIRTGTSIVSIAGKNVEMSGRDRAEIHFASIYAQARIRALAPQKHRDAEPPRLSERERECLEWASMGKSDWEIGEILSISERTAGSHIERAKQKLGVATRIQAVVIALQSGAILI